MRLWAWLLYGALLAAGVALLWARRPAAVPAFEATTALPAGHRLVPGDIMLPGGERYLRHRVPAGGAVSDADLMALPAAAIPHGMTPVTIALAPGANRDVMADRGQAWLCPSLPGTSLVPVTTLICAEGDRTCLAVAGIPTTLVRGLAGSGPHRLSDTPCN